MSELDNRPERAPAKRNRQEQGQRSANARNASILRELRDRTDGTRPEGVFGEQARLVIGFIHEMAARGMPGAVTLDVSDPVTTNPGKFARILGERSRTTPAETTRGYMIGTRGLNEVNQHPSPYYVPRQGFVYICEDARLRATWGRDCGIAHNIPDVPIHTGVMYRALYDPDNSGKKGTEGYDAFREIPLEPLLASIASGQSLMPWFSPQDNGDTEGQRSGILGSS